MAPRLDEERGQISMNEHLVKLKDAIQEVEHIKYKLEGDTIPDFYHLPPHICPHYLEDLHEVFYDPETGVAEVECLRCGSRWFE